MVEISDQNRISTGLPSSKSHQLSGGGLVCKFSGTCNDVTTYFFADTRDPETNIFAPENWWLVQMNFLLGVSAYFQGRLLLVLGSVVWILRDISNLSFSKISFEDPGLDQLLNTSPCEFFSDCDWYFTRGYSEGTLVEKFDFCEISTEFPWQVDFWWEWHNGHISKFATSTLSLVGFRRKPMFFSPSVIVLTDTNLSKDVNEIEMTFKSYPDTQCMVYLYTYIWLLFMVNVGKYAIHWVSGMSKQYMEFQVNTIL